MSVHLVQVALDVAVVEDQDPGAFSVRRAERVTPGRANSPGLGPVVRVSRVNLDSQELVWPIIVQSITVDGIAPLKTFQGAIFHFDAGD